MTLLALDSVRKGFHHLPVLEDLSFALRRGQVLALIGPSGCGKSTLLRLVAGLSAPDSGEIIRRFKQVGFVFQEPRLLPWRTVWDNVALVLERPLSAEDRERLRTLLAQVGLTGFERYYPAQLSGGMRQRVALVRALAVQPDLLLLDEPFSGLDFSLRLRMLQMMSVIFSSRADLGGIYVTHDIREALLLANRVFLLSPRPAHVRRYYDLPDLPFLERLKSDVFHAIEQEIMFSLLSSPLV